VKTLAVGFVVSPAKTLNKPKGNKIMQTQTTQQMFDAYNHALQHGPQSTPTKASGWVDVLIAVSVGLMLAIGALSYFDVLVK
jgi:phosphopantothenoylcysteine synthetase/decarboxylase